MSNGKEWEEWAQGVYEKIKANFNELGIPPITHGIIMDMVKKAAEERRELMAEWAEQDIDPEYEAYMADVGAAPSEE